MTKPHEWIARCIAGIAADPDLYGLSVYENTCLREAVILLGAQESGDDLIDDDAFEEWVYSLSGPLETKRRIMNAWRLARSRRSPLA